MHGCRAGSASENHSETCRQRTEPAMEADDVEETRVEVNRRVREEAGAARQPRAGGPLRTSWLVRRPLVTMTMRTWEGCGWCRARGPRSGECRSESRRGIVGPKFSRCATQEAEGIDFSKHDLKDAVVSEIFCKNRFTSMAPRFWGTPRVCD